MTESSHTVSPWVGLPLFIAVFCIVVWTQVQAGTPIWWAPVVAFASLGFIVALAKCDSKVVLVVALVSGGLFVGALMGVFG